MNQHYIKFVFAVSVLAISHAYVHAQLLAVSGKKIVNSTNNQEVILNAMNLGNWMVMEGYMMNTTSQAPDQHTWKRKLTDLIGSTNTKTFYDAWLNNHVTEADVNQIKLWGFNAVRVPLHYEYFINSGTPDVLNNQGFTILDNLISWCSTAEIYVIIDLHAAPGGQSNNAISDYDNTKPSLWESEANKAKTAVLWRELSNRYRLEPWVAGYDLINEPAWNLPGGTALRDLYSRITTEIRITNGDNHLLFIEGNWYANDFTGLTPAWDANMVYVFHKYWSAATTQDIQWITDFRTQWDRPIWCGEHGENGNDHFTKIVETFNANDIGFSWWPMKKFRTINDFADAAFPAGYGDLVNYFGGANPSLNPTTAFNTVMQLAENVKLENCTLQAEVIRSIFTQPGNRNTEAFSPNAIPGRIYTSNYDKGMNGYAYADQAWEDVRLTTGNYTSWNNGWVYRNNGVDLEATTDPVSNGYTVGWFHMGEWMKYTVNVASAGTYKIEFRIANGNTVRGGIQIQNADGTELLATANVPLTGSWDTWTTISTVGGFSSSGLQAIRIVNASGEFNVNSVNFIYQNGTLPPVLPIAATENVIRLKGNNGLYVAFSNSDNLLTCTKDTQGTTAEFTIVDAGDGLRALKGSNGKYVTLDPFDRKMYCNGATIGDYQKFTLDDLCGMYSIRGYNNLYVSSENGSTAGMTCSRTSPQSWEFFNWTVLRSNMIGVISGIEDSPTGTLNIFPNPAQHNITIEWPENISSLNKAIAIRSLNGVIVRNFSPLTNGHLTTISIEDLPSGMYIIEIQDLDVHWMGKFIKFK